MGKRINKRIVAVLLSLVLILGLFGIVDINVYADNEYPSGGLLQPEVIYNEISEEEYNEILESEASNCTGRDIVRTFKGTDNYWSRFSTAHYNYTNSLTSAQKTFYNNLYNALYGMIDGGSDCTPIYKDNVLQCNAGTPEVSYSGLTKSQAEDVVYLIMYGRPELYFLDSIIKISYTNSNTGSVRIGVYDDFATCASRSIAASRIRSRIDWYLNQVNDSASAYDKEKKIHDLLIAYCTYGNELTTPYSQSCASVFLNANGETVCAGYSEAFCMLCYAKGIPAYSVTSSYMVAEEVKGHEWSQVRLGSYWYAVDVTWDDSSSSNRHFNKSDATMLRLGRNDHTIEALWSRVGRDACLYDYGSEPATYGTTWYNGIDYSAVYDFDYYINTYGDLKNAFGSDSNVAIAHFVNCGMNEGRQAKSTFNVQSYRNQYQDLRLAFGWNNLPAYYNHYRTAGIYEGRNGTGCTSLQNPIHVFWGTDLSPIYDYNYYSQYTDLRNAFGGDDMAMMTHFLSCGMNEGRRGNAGFDVYSYRNQYSDLRQAFGWNNLNAYYSHYLNLGRREGRAGTGCNTLQNPIHTFFGVDFSPVYDYEYYKSHNADLRMAFGDNDMDYFAHFLTNGMNEGRQASAGFNVWTYASNYVDLRNVFGWNLSGYYLHYLSNGIKEGRKAI